MIKQKVLSSSFEELIRILGPVKKPGLTTQEIVERSTKKEKIEKTLRNAYSRGVVTSVPPSGEKTRVSYVLSAKGHQIFEKIDQFTITDRRYTPRKSNKATKPDVAKPDNKKDDGLPVNISIEANNFADHAAALVAQNSHYRAVLMEVHNTIGKLLYPTTTPTPKGK